MGANVNTQSIQGGKIRFGTGLRGFPERRDDTRTLLQHGAHTTLDLLTVRQLNKSGQTLFCT